MNGPDPHSPVDAAAVRRAFGRASRTYDAAARLQREVGARLLERVEEIKLQPRRVLDLGAGTGTATRALQRRFGAGRVVAVDFAPPMLARLRERDGFWRRLTGRRSAAVCADAHALPFADGVFDLVFSSLTLQWCVPEPVFAELARVLAPGKPLLFATLGPDTLIELRRSWAEVDGGAHVNTFLDMHDVGDAMFRAGLGEPVVDREVLTLTYPDVRAMLRELKALGANTVTGRRGGGVGGKGRFAAMERAYEQFRRADGRYPATFEVVYGLAWGREPARADGAAPLSFVPPGEFAGR